MQENKLLFWGVSFFLMMVMMLGCSSHNRGHILLPSSETVTSSWGTYSKAVANYSKIKTGMTEKDLRALGIYDGAINVKVLNWLAVHKMLPRDAVTHRKLDQGILDFIDAGDSRVKAFEIYVLSEHRHREGSLFLDLFSFKRKTRITGHEFRGVILIKDNRVAYVFRPTGGPIDKLRKEKKPLGPFQGFDRLIPRVVSGAI